jgi:hypothetical protein
MTLQEYQGYLLEILRQLMLGDNFLTSCLITNFDWKQV